MMYHINGKGVPSVCQAKMGKCPYGNKSKHFDNKEDAQAEANRTNEKEHGLLPEMNTAKPKINHGNKQYIKAVSMREKNYVRERKYYLKNEVDGSDTYIERCKSCKRLENYKPEDVQTYHFKEERNYKEEGLEKVVGKGTLIGYYEVDHRVRSKDNRNGYRKQIVEIRDNGMMSLYDRNTGKKITTFVGHRARIETMMILANEIPSPSLIEKFEKNKIAADKAGLDN